MSQAAQKRIDEYYMRMALSLALRGTGHTSPNPRVGCVIVKDDKVIGKGWHKKYRCSHAEVNAVEDSKCSIEGSTVYINLEPCSHYGNTPPCADMIAKHRPSRVVIGMLDINPLVSGKGAALLKEQGIEVSVGVLEDECKWINRGFIRRMASGRPWVTLKCGVSLDGCLSLKNGASKWITSSYARGKAHLLRAENDALITGVGTILFDNPKFTVRECDGITPIRVVLDRTLKTPPSSAILDCDSDTEVLFFVSPGVLENKIQAIRNKGAEVLEIDKGFASDEDGILRLLSSRGINYEMIESGSSVIGSFIKEGLVDEFCLFMSSKLLGSGVSFTEKIKIDNINDAITVKNVTVSVSGDDMCVRGIFSCSPDL